MKKKNSSVLQRCMLLKKWPTDEVCHQAGPGERDHRARDARMTTNAASVSTPKT